ncbi:MAG: hypothetical protein IJ840_05300 [Bacteroidales bacterium]|nr:hypothetical protein [Bacteroidales bacterium]
MGLDIYFKRTNLRFEGDPEDEEYFQKFAGMDDTKAQIEFQIGLSEHLNPLKTAWNDYITWKEERDKDAYNLQYFIFVNWLYIKLAKRYDGFIFPYTRKVMDLPQLLSMVETEVDKIGKHCDAYFHKVNFIYAYFEKKGMTPDGRYAIFNDSDLDDLIERCTKVLINHDLADVLLPTKEGFFFGNTEYNENYFANVTDCIDQLRHLKEGFESYNTGYVTFSW